MNDLKRLVACIVALSLPWTSPSGLALAVGKAGEIGRAVSQVSTGFFGTLTPAQQLDLANGIYSLTSSFSKETLLTPAALTIALKTQAQPGSPYAQAATARAVLAAISDPQRQDDLATMLEAVDARTASDSGRRATAALSQLIGRYPELELRSATAKTLAALGLENAPLDSLFDTVIAMPNQTGPASHRLLPFERHGVSEPVGADAVSAPKNSHRASKPRGGLPSISGFLLTVWRALAGWPDPRPDITRIRIRGLDPRTPAQVRANLDARSPEYFGYASAVGSSEERLKDLLLFLEEVAAPYTPEEMYRLFEQNESLYTTGSYPAKKSRQGPDLGAFLRFFWAPKSQIVGGLEKNGEIVVFVHKSYGPFVSSGLPRTFHGKKIVVIETKRASSILNDHWFQAHKEDFYADRPVVLLTGSTSGLGLAMAQQLLKMRYRVVLTGRAQSLSLLKDAGIAEGDDVLIMPLDITSPQDRADAVRLVTERWGGIDILINNASITHRGSIEDTSIETARKQMETDYLGPRELTRGVLPLMRVKGRGRIINISSIAGQVSLPMMEIYSAAKHALDGHTEALEREMAPFGIKVSLAQVSILPTAGVEKIQDVGNPTDAGGPYAKPRDSLVHFSRWAMSQTDATADSVAAWILAALKDKNPPFLIRPSWDGKLFLLAKDILPHFIFDRMVRNALPNYQNWSQIDPAGVLPGRTTGLVAAMQQSIEFARNFIGDLQGRATRLTEGRSTQAGARNDYVPPKNRVTAKLKGKLIIRSSVGEFFDLWASWIERGHGSVNDRQYADLAIKYRRWAAHIPLLRYIPMTSDDDFTASIVDGKMQFMTETTITKTAWLIPSATLRWNYRRTREPTDSDAFEKAIDDYNGDLSAIQAYYEDFFDPKRLNPKSRATVRFTLAEDDQLQEPLDSGREFEHSISLPFGLPVPKAFLTSAPATRGEHSDF